MSILCFGRFGFTAVVLSSILAGCGGSGSGGVANNDQSNDDLALLQSVASDEEFLDAFRSGVEAEIEQNAFSRTAIDISGALIEPLAAPSAEADDSAGSGAYTTTYTLEADVDEYDLVKYNGEHIFIVRSLQNYCCDIIAMSDAVTADGIAAPVDLPSPSSSIRILATDPNDATAEEVGSIRLESGDTALGMYVAGDQLIALTTSYYYGTYGSVWKDIGYWANQTLGALIYDIGDILEPELQWDIEIEGSLVQSRRVGDTVYFVTRHTPAYDRIHYYPAGAEDLSENQQVLDELTLADVIPQVSVDGEVSDLFDPRACYVTNEALDTDSRGYPVITSITAVPVDNPKAMTTSCYNESASGVYMSDSAIYLTDVRYDDLYEGSTRIHKFAMADSGVNYRGSAEVDGYLWTWGQRDFRINEHDGMLRLVTTSYEDSSEDRLDHHLYILEEDAANKELDLVSELPNGARPQEIGKPNEALYGVRFFGDRAYMVTFEQIDPLYVMDLSDPEDPQITGELEVTGFSDFLHPVNDDLLLGLGSEAAWGSRVKLELFDVSDLSSPTSVDVEYIGGESDYSYSEAQYNRYAFTYQANAEDGVDRFAVPANIWGREEGGDYYSNTALHLYEIADKDFPALASMQKVGDIEPTPESGDTDWWYSYLNRSIFHEDAVFYVYGGYVWSALWDDTDNQTGPQ